MQSNSGVVVILGAGGTIAGRAAQAADNVGYKAGEVAVADLVAAVPALQARALEAEQVAQLDSKDMDHATWQRLAQRVAHHLARPEVAGIVVTHGTDTAEETAWLLQRVLAPAKPVVLAACTAPRMCASCTATAWIPSVRAMLGRWRGWRRAGSCPNGPGRMATPWAWTAWANP